MILPRGHPLPLSLRTIGSNIHFFSPFSFFFLFAPPTAERREERGERREKREREREKREEKREERRVKREKREKREKSSPCGTCLSSLDCFYSWLPNLQLKDPFLKVRIGFTFLSWPQKALGTLDQIDCQHCFEIRIGSFRIPSAR